MQMSDYQQESRKTAIYPQIGENITYPTLGLVGEAGEVANKVKKVIRDAGGVVGEEVRSSLKEELGDVLWYIAQLATELDLDLDEIAETNIKKLAARQERGTLKGSGDHR